MELTLGIALHEGKFICNIRRGGMTGNTGAKYPCSLLNAYDYDKNSEYFISFRFAIY